MLTKLPIARPAKRHNLIRVVSFILLAIVANKPLPFCCRGLKFLDAGRLRENEIDSTRQVKPIIAETTCQENHSANRLATTRPIMPPKMVPVMYNPIERLNDTGETSSPMYAIAIAATPDNENPFKAL